MKIWIRAGRKLLVPFVLINVLVGPASPGVRSATNEQIQQEVSPLRTPAPGIMEAEIFAKLVERSRQQDIALDSYSATRTYQVSNPKGKVYARDIVEFQFNAPDKRIFNKKSGSGSWLVRHLVFDQLIQAEAKASTGEVRHHNAITPLNYSFSLVGDQKIGPYDCYVIRAVPRRKDKYLFEGTLWISSQDFGIVRISGHPARKLSMWIKTVDFVRRYQKFGEFWLPISDETRADIRFNGPKILSIKHDIYRINGVSPEKATVQIPPAPRHEKDFHLDTLDPVEARPNGHENAAAQAQTQNQARIHLNGVQTTVWVSAAKKSC